jgi:hypothetical protein
MFLFFVAFLSTVSFAFVVVSHSDYVLFCCWSGWFELVESIASWVGELVVEVC